MTRHAVSLAARLAAPKPPASPPRGAVGSAADRYPRVGRPRADSPLSVGRGEAAAEVEGAGLSIRAIPRRRQLHDEAYEFRTVRLPRPRHLHRRARRWASWHPVDRLGAWVHDVGLFVLALVAVSVWAGSLVGTAVLVGGAS